MIDNRKEVSLHHFEVIGNSFIYYSASDFVYMKYFTGLCPKPQIKMIIIACRLGWNNVEIQNLSFTDANLDLRPDKTYSPPESLCLRNIRRLGYISTKLTDTYCLPSQLPFFLISQSRKNIRYQQKKRKWSWNNITLIAGPLNVCFIQFSISN